VQPNRSEFPPQYARSWQEGAQEYETIYTKTIKLEKGS